MRVHVCLAALTVFLNFSSANKVSAQPISSLTGSWVWIQVNGGHASQNNATTLIINNQRSGRYCYNTTCHNVQLTARNNTWTFSTNNNNYFEFVSPEPDVMIGRFWHNRNVPGSPPDAVVRMTER
jgi:hypothetical protein